MISSVRRVDVIRCFVVLKQLFRIPYSTGILHNSLYDDLIEDSLQIWSKCHDFCKEKCIKRIIFHNKYKNRLNSFWFIMYKSH